MPRTKASVRASRMPAQLKRYWMGVAKGTHHHSPMHSHKKGVTMKSSRRNHGVKVPMAIVLGFAPFVANGINSVRQTGWNEGIRMSMSSIIPWDFAQNRFTMDFLGRGLYPILAGFLVHKVIGSMLGINKSLGRLGVPFIRI